MPIQFGERILLLSDTNQYWQRWRAVTLPRTLVKQGGLVQIQIECVDILSTRLFFWFFLKIHHWQLSLPLPLLSLLSLSSSFTHPPPHPNCVSVGVWEVAWGLCGQCLWPPWPLHPRCPLLVCGPFLLHRLHVSLPQGVQDEPLLSHQGTYRVTQT